MDNLELLKHHLITQKTILENKGIIVETAHTNPSPSEITNALNKIEVADFTVATATESDVLAGKTFFSGDTTLKTGTREDCENEYTDLAMFLLGGVSVASYTDLVIPSGLTEIRDFCFQNYGDALSGEITIPEGVVTIGTHAFMSTNITKINFPSTVTTLGANCFYGALNLTKLEIPDSVTSIGINLFSNIKNATSIYIGGSLTTLESNCFKELTYVTTVTIPEQITTIKSSNFNTMPALTDLYIKSNNITCSNSSFLNIHINDLKIWLNFDALAYYSSATNIASLYEHFISEITLAESETFPASSVIVEWYSNLDDAKARTNAITEPLGSGTYYARLPL